MTDLHSVPFRTQTEIKLLVKIYVTDDLNLRIIRKKTYCHSKFERISNIV